MKKTDAPSSALPPRGIWRLLALLSLAANVAFAVWAWRSRVQPPPPAPVPSAVSVDRPKPHPRELNAYVALGSYMAENNRVPDLGWSEAQFTAFIDGFRASFEGRGLPLDDEARRLRDEISQRVQAMVSSGQSNPIEDYFRTLREKEGVSRTPSGLHYRLTETGTGPKPRLTDSVVLSFTARLPDGQTLTPLTRVRSKIVVQDLLPGLAEGVQLLQVGGKALVYVPPALAFANDNWPPNLPRNTPLIFFLELHEIVSP